MLNAATRGEAGRLSRSAGLPAAAWTEASPDKDVTDSVPAGKRKLRVLVADDYPDAGESSAMLLRLWGHEVRVACDGTAALEMARAWRPDVVLADIAMPLLNGYDLARQLRQEPGFQQTLLIAISGWADESHRVLGLEAGYDLYLAKPAASPRLQQLLFVELNRLFTSGELSRQSRQLSNSK